MLRTDQRALLLDLLSPPMAGYRLEHAVGTSFTLHLDALLRAPLAVAGKELRDSLDPLGVMQAVRSSADRITLFCQTGMIAAPAQSNRLLAFLEPVVHAVERPTTGRLFHPKIWLTAWTHPDGPRRFRFLCTSRNMTADRAWDAVVGLDGTETSRPHAVNRSLSEFIASLPPRTVLPLEAARRNAIEDLAEAVRRAEWEMPEGATSDNWLRFHWLDTGRRFRPGVDEAQRQLVISPFVSPDGLTAIDGGGPLTLISRPETIAELGEDARTTLTNERDARFRVLDDAAALPDEDDDAGGLRWSLRGLHAKVFVTERKRVTHLMIGSANATGAAFDGNTEFLVELVCRRKAVSVEGLLKDQEDGFGALLLPWNQDEAPPEEDPRKQLEQLVVDLAAVPLQATAIETAEERWSLRLTSKAPLNARLPDDLTLTLQPLTIQAPRGARADTPLELSWPDVAPDEVTPWFVLELRQGTGAQAPHVRTVVRAALEGGPEDRLDRVLAHHVESPEAFLRFLMILLQFAEGEAMFLPEGDEEGAGAAWLMRMQQQGVLESLLRALAERPEALDEIDGLVQRLENTEDGRARFPEGWTALWTEIRAARELLYGTESRHR